MPATYEPIASQTLGSNTATVTFSSIPGTYTDLRLVFQCKTSDASSRAVLLRLNSDTAGNYSWTRLYGSGSSAASDRFTGAAPTNYNFLDVGFLPGGANGLGFSAVDLMSYANTNVFKTVLCAWESQQAASGSQFVTREVGLWRSTSAITQIDLSMATGDVVSGATFSLYGIKAA